MDKKPKIVVVIPSYNEKENIQKIIGLIFSLLPNSSVIIIDDNSPDGTGKTVAALQKTRKNLYLISRKVKAGRGSAVMEGFKFALKNISPKLFVEMDADLSHNPKEISQMIKLSKPKTVVIASRYMRGGKLLKVEPKRRILSYLANLLIRGILQNPIIDNTNGFRCYRREQVECLLKHKFISKGYILLSESATVLRQNGFKFVEFPSVFVNRVKGKSNATLAEFIHSLVSLIGIKRYLTKS